MIDNIKNNGKRLIGQSSLVKHLRGERLTRQKAIEAKCYDCMGYYEDFIGKDKDCKSKECPLYPYMPYKGGNKNEYE